MKYVVASPVGEVSIFEVYNGTDVNENDYTVDALAKDEFYSWALFGRDSSKDKWKVVKLFKEKEKAEASTAYHRDGDLKYYKYKWSCATKILGILKEININESDDTE
jgi:hypothetical protein